MTKKLYLITAFIINSATMFGQGPEWAWAKSGGGAGNDWVFDITADAHGNAYITGGFQSPVFNFGGHSLTNAAQEPNFFIAKLDASGNVPWLKKATGGSHGEGRDIASDADGNTYVTGYFYSPTATFGGIVLTNTDNSGQTADVFIVKYDSSGTAVWAVNATGDDNEQPSSITLDNNGSLYITGGFFSSMMSFDTTQLFNAGFYNMFIAKYDTAGNMLWAHGGVGSNNNEGAGVATDPNGNVYITGTFTGPIIIFGSDTLTNIDSTNQWSDLFLVKYDSPGSVLWAKSAGGTLQDRPDCFAVDALGNAYIAGDFSSSSLAFGTTILTNSDTIFVEDGFIAKYDSSGAVSWAKSVSNSGIESCYAIALDAGGNAFITGRFDSDSLTFGNTTLVNGGYSDAFFAKYDSAGNAVWAKNITSPDTEVGFGMATDPTGNVFISGIFFGPQVYLDTLTLFNTNSNIDSDILIAKLDSGVITTVMSTGDFLQTINIYPNPSAGTINILSSFTIEKIKITNLVGQVIYEKALTNKSKALQLSNALPSGIYFISVTGTNQRVTRRIAVVNK